MNPRVITIYRTPRGWDVHEGERYSGQLSWDEMLGQVAALTFPSERVRDPQQGLFCMRTPEEEAAQRERRRRNWVSPVSRELGPMALEALTIFAREHGSRGGDADELLPWYAQSDARVRLALMLLDACRAPGADVVNAEVP